MAHEYRTYRKELRALGYGLPIYEPDPSGYDRVRVGDVGRVTNAGYFERVFNVFYSGEHEFNRRFGVPEGFECVESESMRETTRLNEIKAHSCLRSEQIRSIEADVDFSAYVLDF